MQRTARMAAAVVMSVLAFNSVQAETPAAAVVANVRSATFVRTTHGAATLSWRGPESSKSVGVTTHATPNDASTIMTLHDRAAPPSYTFALHLPAGSLLTPDGAGGYALMNTAYVRGAAVVTVIGHFEAPWARDATGRRLQTSYSLAGNSLIQRINVAGAQFPVIADPHYTWGWVTGTIYLNKLETHNVATSSFGVSAVCALVGVFATPIAGAGCLAGGAGIVLVANWAYNAHECEKLKVSFTGYLGPALYSGRYCT